MTISRIVPWGRKQVPVRRTEGFSAPRIWTDFDEPLREMERMFDNFFSLTPGAFVNTQQQFSPALDVNESENEFQINLEMPGMSEKDLDISVSRDTLTITGEKKEEKEENSKGIYRLERRYGTFSRTIPLPDNCVETEKIEASFKNGILTIKLPKAVDYKDNVKKIPILTSEKNSASSEKLRLGANAPLLTQCCFGGNNNETAK